MNLFPGTPSFSDPDVIEVSASNNQKRKRSQAIDIIQIDEDDDPDGVVIIGQTLPSHKPKPPLSLPPPNSNNISQYASQPSMDWLMHVQDNLAHFPAPSTSTTNPPLPANTASLQPSVASTLEDFSFADYEYFQDDDFFDDYDSLLYDNTAMNVEPSSNLEAKFDGLDIPTGVEASLPWLQKCFASGSGSSSGSRLKQPKVVNDEIDINYKAFKQFDTVSDHTDHHFMRPKFKSSSQKVTC